MSPDFECKTCPDVSKFQNTSEKQHFEDSENFDEFPDLTDFLENHYDLDTELIDPDRNLINIVCLLVMLILIMYGHPEDKLITEHARPRSVPQLRRCKSLNIAIDSLPEIQKSEKSRPQFIMKNGKRIKLRKGITVDSGAANNVMPRRMVRNKAKIRPSPASIRGVHYVAANNGRIPNEGEVDFEFTTDDGHYEFLVMQIAEVNKALGSVSYMVDTGFRVVFDRDEETGVDLSMMVHKATGRATRFRREKNIWVLDAYVQNGDVIANESFVRQP